MVVGVVVTSVAAWLPARRAAKVAPIEALRESSLEAAGASRRRVVLGCRHRRRGRAFTAQGCRAPVVGVVGLGALAVFVGVVMLGPVIARRFAQVAGWPLRRVRGDRRAHSPGRTPCATPAARRQPSSALMIGVASGRVHHRVRGVGEGVDVDIGRPGDEE